MMVSTKLLQGLIFAASLTMASLAYAQDADTEEAQPEPDRASVLADEEQFSALGIVQHQWAVINSDGRIAHHRNVIRAKKLGPGIYEVIFRRDVSKGVYCATVGSGTITGAITGQVSVSPRAGNKQGVFVRTTDSKGSQADRAFHLLVLID